MNTNLEKWRFYLNNVESPQIFIDWSWYSAVAATLQRRVSFGGDPSDNEFQIYPNMYLVFVGPPGVGKSITANKARDLINSVNNELTRRMGAKAKLIKIGPQTTSLAALVSFIGVNYTLSDITPLFGEKKIYHHCSVSLFATDELENLLSSEMGDLVSFLNTAWDCGSYYKITKTQGTDVLNNMCLNLLGCCTPEWISSSIASKILKAGFAARTIFVWGGAKRKFTPFIRVSEEQRKAKQEIVKYLADLANVYGEVKITPEAEEYFTKYYETMPFNRINKDKKLDYYYERKKVHIIKTAINIHFSDSTDMVLTIDDIKKAISLLEETEKTMHLALMYSGRNTLSSTASEVAEYLKECNRPVTEAEILQRFFSIATLNEIKTIMTYLYETKQIEIKRIGSDVCYSYKGQ